MSSPFHGDLALGEIHIAANWEYANAAARTGASGFISSDVGKVARQLSDNSLWLLTATTPTWVRISDDPAAFDRANHTGVQDTSTITGLAEYIRDTIGAALVAGSRVTITVNDAGDTITVASDDASTAEFVRDTIGTALVAGSGITVTVNDAGDTITIAASGAGHTIQNNGTPLTARANLNFVPGSSGVTITDDSANNATVVDFTSLTGGGGRAAGPLVEQILSVAASTFTMTIPAGYKSVFVEFQPRGSTSSQNVGLTCQVNGDTGGNYDYKGFSGNVGLGQYGALNGTSFDLQWCPDSAAPTGIRGNIELALPDYEDTTFHKNIRGRNALQHTHVDTNNLFVLQIDGWWRSTAAITSITFIIGSGNFVAGTTGRVWAR